MGLFARGGRNRYRPSAPAGGQPLLYFIPMNAPWRYLLARTKDDISLARLLASSSSSSAQLGLRLACRGMGWGCRDESTRFDGGPMARRHSSHRLRWCFSHDGTLLPAGSV